MQSYEISFEGDDVIIRRIMDEVGDTFVVNNLYKEHVGRLVTGTVEVTYSDKSVVVFQEGETTLVRTGDSWVGVTQSAYTVTECRLNVNDNNTWLEVGMTRERLEQSVEKGLLSRKLRAKAEIQIAGDERIRQG